MTCDQTFKSLVSFGFPNHEISVDGIVRQIQTKKPLSIENSSQANRAIVNACGNDHKVHTRLIYPLVCELWQHEPEETWKNSKYAQLIRHWVQLNQWLESDFMRPIPLEFFCKHFTRTLWVTRDGRIFDAETRKEIKPSPAGQGYLAAKVSVARRQPMGIYLHRAVAITFIPIPDSLKDFPLEVNHINLDKTDNRVENLEWITHRGNQRHAAIHGRMTSSDNVFKNVPLICYMLSQGYSNRDIGDLIGVDQNTIRHIRNHKHVGIEHYLSSRQMTWPHRSKDIRDVAIYNLDKEGISRDLLSTKFQLGRMHINRIIRDINRRLQNNEPIYGLNT